MTVKVLKTVCISLTTPFQQIYSVQLQIILLSIANDRQLVMSRRGNVMDRKNSVSAVPPPFGPKNYHTVLTSI